MLRDALKREIDQLNEGQLKQIAALVASMRATQNKSSIPFWQRATLAERIARLRAWPKSLPQDTPVLPDEAFDRGNIYD